MERSAFATAARYFKEGINFLEVTEKWNNWYDLTLELVSSSAENEFYMGNFDSSERAIKEIHHHAHCPDDTMRAQLTHLEILSAQSKFPEFISASLALLGLLLGVHISDNPSSGETRYAYKKMSNQLHSNSNETFLNLPILEDPKKVAAVQIMTGMVMPLDMKDRNSLGTLVISKLVDFSLQFGVTERSPDAFGAIGAFLISRKGDIKEGSRFGDLAISLCTKLHGRLDARVSIWSYFCCKHWQSTPVSKCVTPVFNGHSAGMRSGDTFCAFLAITSYCMIYFYSGLSLPPLLHDIQEFATQLLEYGQKTAYLTLLPVWQTVLNLSGADNPLDMMGGHAIAKQHLVGNDSMLGEQSCWSFQMQICFYLGELELASSVAAKVQAIDVGLGKSHPMYAARVFFFGLIAVARARETGRRKFRREASKHIDIIKDWTTKGSVNCLHKLLILEAEFATLSTKKYGIEGIKEQYDKAVGHATKTGFQQDAALCKQLCGAFLYGYPESKAYACDYLQDSFTRWKQWGADAIAISVKERYPEFFVGESSTPGNELGFLSVKRFDKTLSERHHESLSLG